MASPSSSATTTVELQLKTTFEYAKLSAAKEHKILLMGSVEAPKHEQNAEEKRAACDIIAVIDRSGSMGGEKLDLVKKTLDFMVDQLHSDDNMALVTFDTYVETNIGITQMTADNKAKAKSIFQQLTAGDSTNLSGGLYEGIDIVKKRTKPNKVVSILLFTDGLANVGIKDAATIVNGVEKTLQQQLTTACSIFTFGFGKDHDANMLTQIANAGSGLYYYIQQEDEIPESFANCLGGLLSVVAQNVKISVEAVQEGVIINRAISSYKKSGNNEIKDKKLELVLGDMYSEEKRDVLFEVTIPAVTKTTGSEASEASYEPVKVTLSYFNVVNTGLVDHSVNATIVRSFDEKAVAQEENSGAVAANAEIDKQRVRIRSVEALAQARELANKNDIAQARQILQTTMNSNAAAHATNQVYAQAMNADLQNCLNNMRDQREYNSTGNKLLNMNWAANQYQRHTSKQSAVQQMAYQTPMQAQFEQQVQVLKTPKKPQNASPPPQQQQPSQPSPYQSNYHFQAPQQAHPSPSPRNFSNIINRPLNRVPPQQQQQYLPQQQQYQQAMPPQLLQQNFQQQQYLPPQQQQMPANFAPQNQDPSNLQNFQLPPQQQQSPPPQQQKPAADSKQKKKQ